jgi:hypothetical protein
MIEEQWIHASSFNWETKHIEGCGEVNVLHLADGGAFGSPTCQAITDVYQLLYC